MKRRPTWTAGWLTTATVVFVIASATTLAAQDFTVRMQDEDGKISTHYVSRNAVRNVSSTPVDTDVIYRLDQGKIITLNHKQKTYTEITLAEARQQMEKKQSEMGPQQQEVMRRLGMAGAAASITKIGAGETIAGYATEKYAAKTPLSQGEIWVAPALELPPGYYDMVTSFVAGQVGAMGQMFKEMKEKQVKGFALKWVATTSMPMMKGITFTRVATSVEKGPIPASTFEPPAGYQKVRAQES
jgi:hypothetical protein